jgi:hypothetical protein
MQLLTNAFTSRGGHQSDRRAAQIKSTSTPADSSTQARMENN